MFEVILFYKYISIEDPKKLVEDQLALCKKLGLKGRILIAREGINGTLEGLKENTAEYCSTTASLLGSHDIHWKRSVGNGKTFPRLSVTLKKDIVSNAIVDWKVDPRKKTATHMSPEMLKEWIATGKDFHIVDMRNDYEHAVGHFENSVLPPLQNFRDLPKVLPKLEHLKEKTVVTVCTGGVRCEKASALLLEEGFRDVYQLDGGIVSYMEKYKNQDFKGKLYVFDQRIVMGFDTDAPEHTVIGKCGKCGKTSENYINCANLLCHLHFICCKECMHDEVSGFCSIACMSGPVLKKQKADVV